MCTDIPTSTHWSGMGKELQLNVEDLRESPGYSPAMAQGCDNHNKAQGSSLATQSYQAAAYFNCCNICIWLETGNLSSWESLGQPLGQGPGGGELWWKGSWRWNQDQFQLWVQLHTSWRRGISQEKNQVKKSLPFCYAALSKDREEQNCPLWKGNVGMGQSGLCFINTCLITLFPVSGARRTFPEFQGCLVSRPALADPACVHGCACSMCNSSRQTHTGRHTQTDIVHGQKTLRSFFSNKDTACYA